MVIRKTKEDRSARETQPVVLPVKQKESLSYMNSREFTYIFDYIIYIYIHIIKVKYFVWLFVRFVRVQKYLPNNWWITRMLR